MDTFIKKLKEERSLKPRTIVFYSKNLEKMAKVVTLKPFENLDFLENVKKILEYLKTLKISTRKNKVATIVTALKLYPKYSKITETYENLLAKINEEYEEQLVENKKSVRESENWVTLDELIDVWNTLRKKIVLEKIDKLQFINKKQRRLLQEFVICSLYILQEPRRCQDFSEMKYIQKDKYDKLSEGALANNNFLVYKGAKVLKFSYGDYKTSHKYGNQTFDVPTKLKKVLNLYLKHRLKDQSYILLNYRSEKMSSNSLTKYLWQIFSPTGKKKISSSMLRHIFITENNELKEYRKIKEKAEHIAKKMAHSLDMQQKYFRN